MSKTLFQYSIEEYKQERVNQIRQCYKDYLTKDLLMNLEIITEVAIKEAYSIGRIDKEKEVK
ncbi:MAG: hypothetical protein PHI16_06285 [Methanocellales archaeon]|nr:hypothetical protein [Methanocellales archaeon]